MKVKKRKKSRLLLLLVLLLMVMVISASFYLYKQIQNDNMTSTYYLADDKQYLELKAKDETIRSFPRGLDVDIKNKIVKLDEVEYRQFEYEDNIYYVKQENLEIDRRNCVKETTVYALRDHVLCKDYDDYHITSWVKEKDELHVDGYHELDQDGNVDYYFVNNIGYISSEYVGLEFYDTSYDAQRYSDVYFKDGGNPLDIRYYPKKDYDVKMPEVVNALYINAESIKDVDEYLSLAEDAGDINAFVVDIKDCYNDTQLAYNSKVALQYAPSTFNIPNTFDEYAENIKKLKDAGYYLIGRITAFKDDSFAQDNPDEALLYNGSLYTYGSVKWPSIYSRKMWEYNVALALEACNEFGFDEIQFDYIRLPEDVEDVDLRNIYNESRAQAVTNFLRYAYEYLHLNGINVSADVFGETSGDEMDEFSCFVAYYGQFWPAISNVVDAISSMPYPDHFAAYAYGIDTPWSKPGELMYAWSKATYHAQENTYDPAKCRTWIMAQNSDEYEIIYDVSKIIEQIDALKKAGVYDGYLTWNAASSLTKYKQYLEAFN